MLRQGLFNPPVADWSCRQVAIIGASTPMLPDAFSATNVTLLSGVVVQEPEKVLRVVSEGGGMRQFKPYVRKVNWRKLDSDNVPIQTPS